MRIEQAFATVFYHLAFSFGVCGTRYVTRESYWTIRVPALYRLLDIRDTSKLLDIPE